MEITFDRSQMLKAVNTAKSFAEGSSGHEDPAEHLSSQPDSVGSG